MNQIYTKASLMIRDFITDMRVDFASINKENELKLEVAAKTISSNVAFRYIESKSLNKPDTNELYEGNNALLYALLSHNSYDIHRAGQTTISSKYGLKINEFIMGIGEQDFLDSATPGHDGIPYWRIQEFGSDGGYVIKPRGSGYKLKFKVIDQTSGSPVEVEADHVIHPGVKPHAFYLSRGGSIYTEDIEAFRAVMSKKLLLI